MTESLLDLYNQGYRSIAVCLAHSYTFPLHELRIGEIAHSLGFTHVSMSSQVSPMIKLVNRGMSAMTDAYLTPTVKRYLDSFSAGFEGGLVSPTGNRSLRCQLMQSDGGLVHFLRFSGLRAILSGPAGGGEFLAADWNNIYRVNYSSDGSAVVGCARTSYDSTEKIPIIGIDMGGTSTDTVY